MFNESDPHSNVHYLGSSENKAWKKIQACTVNVKGNVCYLSVMRTVFFDLMWNVCYLSVARTIFFDL